MRRPGEKLAKRNLLQYFGGSCGVRSRHRPTQRWTENDMDVAAVISVGVISSAIADHLQYRRTRSREKQRDVDDIIDDITLVAQAAELTGWDERMWRTEASLALVRAVDALPTRTFTSEEATGADNCCAVCLAEFREGACAASRSRRRDPDGAAPAL